MATVLPKLASVQLTYAEYAKIAAGTWTLPSGVRIDSMTDNLDGATLTVIFAGSSLGDFAQPQAIAGHIEVPGTPPYLVNIEAIGSSSSSSGA